MRMSPHIRGKMVVLVLGGALGGLGSGAAMAAALATPPARPAPAAVGKTSASFEELLRQATAAPDAETLAAPFAEDCERSRREIDRARCRGTQDFLRAKLPEKLLHTVVDSTRVVSVSAYDASVRGFRVRVLGCLTCDDPAKGPEGDELYLTLAAPQKQSETLREGVIIGETRVNFSEPDAARAFETKVKPHLRAEFLFKGNGTTWSHRGKRGVAFAPVAMRIFDRCTGEVLFSEPRSEAAVNVVEGLAGCGDQPAVAAGETSAPKKTGEDLTPPEKLGPRELGDAIKATQKAVAACDSQFRTRGTVEVVLDLDGNGGSARAVRAKGNLGGTPVATCVTEAVRGAKFPRFQQASQTVSFQVSLAGK
jgi:hypothetical protein